MKKEELKNFNKNSDDSGCKDIDESSIYLSRMITISAFERTFADLVDEKDISDTDHRK